MSVWGHGDLLENQAVGALYAVWNVSGARQRATGGDASAMQAMSKDVCIRDEVPAVSGVSRARPVRRANADAYQTADA